jgi:acyl-coenzyme A thioesterase PaaI-like protein
LNISLLPFNKLIGLEVAGPEGNLMVSLPAGSQYLNHLGTVHGSALLAVAEAGSGEYLFRNLGHIENVIPVVRKLEAKFRKPANGRLVAKCAVARPILDGWVSELEVRGRVSADVPVEVIDSTNTIVLSAIVGWFITKR